VNFYLVAVQRIKPEHPAYQDGVGKAAAQVTRTAMAYSKLRACLEPILPPDHEPPSREGQPTQTTQP
jgi:hypothetical protein